MVKKIGKKVLLATSVIISGTLGFLFNGSRNADQSFTDTITQQPIFSIEKVYGDSCGGDCSCSNDYSEPWTPPDPVASAWVHVEFVP
jgi:hypothetical protein